MMVAARLSPPSPGTVGSNICLLIASCCGKGEQGQTLPQNNVSERSCESRWKMVRHFSFKGIDHSYGFIQAATR